MESSETKEELKLFLCSSKENKQKKKNRDMGKSEMREYDDGGGVVWLGLDNKNSIFLTIKINPWAIKIKASKLQKISETLSYIIRVTIKALS